MKKQMVGLLCAIATGAVNVSVAETINYKVSDTITATLDDEGVLTLIGDGEVPDYKWLTDRPWHNQSKDIKSIGAVGNITRIGKHAFTSLGYLENITLPTVQVIGERAFGGCGNLDTVFLPNVKKLEDAAFQGCDWLITLYIPSVTEIGFGALGPSDQLFIVTVSWPLALNPDREYWGATEFVEFLPPMYDYEIETAKYTLALVNQGGRLFTEDEYEFACKEYGLTQQEKPQIVPEGSIAVRREAISAANAETVKIEDGVIHLGISVSRSEDITAPTADWNKVTISKDDIDVSEDGTQIIVKIPANAQQGFMILQSKDAKVNTED